MCYSLATSPYNFVSLHFSCCAEFFLCKYLCIDFSKCTCLYLSSYTTINHHLHTILINLQLIYEQVLVSENVTWEDCVNWIVISCSCLGAIIFFKLQKVGINKIATPSVVILWLPTFWSSKILWPSPIFLSKKLWFPQYIWDPSFWRKW